MNTNVFYIYNLIYYLICRGTEIFVSKSRDFLAEFSSPHLRLLAAMIVHVILLCI